MTTQQDFARDSFPANKHVLNALGIINGSMLCRIYWATNLKDHVCRMGLTRLGDDLGIGRSTAGRAVAYLVENGYISKVKEADQAKGQPPHYLVTDKFWELLQGDQSGDPVPQRDTPVPERGTPVPQRDTPVPERGTPVPQRDTPVPERDKEKESDIDIESSSRRNKKIEQPQPTAEQPLAKADDDDDLLKFISYFKAKKQGFTTPKLQTAVVMAIHTYGVDRAIELYDEALLRGATDLPSYVLTLARNGFTPQPVKKPASPTSKLTPEQQAGLKALQAQAAQYATVQ